MNLISFYNLCVPGQSSQQKEFSREDDVNNLIQDDVNNLISEQGFLLLLLSLDVMKSPGPDALPNTFF